jgi:hypothetical protein
MYWGDLKTFEEIADDIGENWWTIKELFNQFNVPRMTVAERARYKREQDYSLIYNLHFVEGLSLAEISRQYGFAPHYSRKVLKGGEKLVN